MDRGIDLEEAEAAGVSLGALVWVAPRLPLLDTSREALELPGDLIWGIRSISSAANSI